MRRVWFGVWMETAASELKRNDDNERCCWGTGCAAQDDGDYPAAHRVCL